MTTKQTTEQKQLIKYDGGVFMDDEKICDELDELLYENIDFNYFFEYFKRDNIDKLYKPLFLKKYNKYKKKELCLVFISELIQRDILDCLNIPTYDTEETVNDITLSYCTPNNRQLHALSALSRPNENIQHEMTCFYYMLYNIDIRNFMLSEISISKTIYDKYAPEYKQLIINKLKKHLINDVSNIVCNYLI